MAWEQGCSCEKDQPSSEAQSSPWWKGYLQPGASAENKGDPCLLGGGLLLSLPSPFPEARERHHAHIEQRAAHAPSPAESSRLGDVSKLSWRQQGCCS